MDPDDRNQEQCRRIGMNITYIYNNERITIVKCGSWPPWKQVESIGGDVSDSTLLTQAY